MEASFLTGANAAFIAELYQKYLDDPSSLDSQWVGFFKEMGDSAAAASKDISGPVWGRARTQVIGAEDPDPPAAKKGKPAAGSGASGPETKARILDSIRALMIVRTYQVRGHLMARLDPLGINQPVMHPELDYRSYGFSDADLDREIFIDGAFGLEKASLKRIMELVHKTYCGSIGIEFMHIQYPDQKKWIQERIEEGYSGAGAAVLGKKEIYERLCEAEGFEKFLQVKYTGTKRFGIEGGESTIPAIEQILHRGSQLGIVEVVIGMAHRGRLNILSNIMRKPYRAMFSEFQGNSANPEDVQGSGDVKYHLGTSVDRDFDGKQIHLSLQANPSHLETVDPIVLGKVRARQVQIGDTERTQVLALLLHGDAAFSGQGVVAECFGMSQLKGYRTGGTIHLVINNQIGFTTAPQYSRSGTYCTEIAKMVQAPILHVNGDDPEAVAHAARIAIEYRQTFKADVVLDIVCYRRYGHNESDEPAFTQPNMYKKIAAHETTRTLYAKRLVTEGFLTQAEADATYNGFQYHLEKEFEAASSYKPNKADWLENRWKGLTRLSEEEESQEYDTQVAEQILQEVGKALYTPPGNFDVNRKILRQLKAKEEMFKAGQDIDWATAEALAFGTLLVDDHPVRLSGQDCGRGTFSQRHSVIVDQTSEQTYVPLNHIRSGQATYEVLDSPLSEYGVLGYEYGYSMAEPNGLVLWEAQFGDFANGAQIIFDQYVAAAESKWLRLSGLVVLLPHGFEGQGPEHSSARPERFLQLCAEDNMQVCNLTTPANYFHALRRQVRRNFRKPLIIMTPKSLLRHKLAISKLTDLGPGSSFRRVIGEGDSASRRTGKVRRVVVCSGKLYYDLLQAKNERDIADVALVRVEQLYPWPKAALIHELSYYPGAELIWCQEEPANGGYWTFVKVRLDVILEEMGNKTGKAYYVGRPASASPATGSYKKHNEEQARMVEQALTWPCKDLPQPFRRAPVPGKSA